MFIQSNTSNQDHIIHPF